ncbi:MAG: PIF1 family ATP-dependent DNA helicase [Candidatus Moraniibacteriota bacterium]
MNQETALAILKKRSSVYLTGPAGSGKTYLLNLFVAYLKEKKIKVAVTASTGLAATHLSGRTIHSWSGIGIGKKLDATAWKKIKSNRQLRKRVLEVEVLIIDEISMLHDYQLDMIDEICRHFRKSAISFGGIQVVMCGDFFQLPPVGEENGSANFVMQAAVWQKMSLKICYLDKVYRQSDEKLTEILNRIRGKEIDDDLFSYLDGMIEEERKFSLRPARLYAHNIAVDSINLQELRKIKDGPMLYYMHQRGSNDRLLESLKGACQASEKLVLKKGAVVMFIKNNPDLGYANGTIGEVIGFEEENKFPIIRISDGQEIIASPESWTIDDEDGKALALVTQVPLKLAWAITIHKSQGMTLDAVEMDLSKCFAYGMGYVALSRAKSLKSIKLLGLSYRALEVDPKIFEADKLLQEWSAAVEREYLKNKPKSLKEKIKDKILGKK